MRKSRFTEEQIIGILKEHQAGLKAARARVSSPTVMYHFLIESRGLAGACRAPDADGCDCTV